MFARLLKSSLGIILLTATLFTATTALAQDPANGEKLFKANCGACHIMGRNMTGPNLQGVEERWADKELLYLWIQNPSKAKATGDPYVMDLLAEWEPKSGLMPAQAVTKSDIDDILAYVNAWEPPQPAQTEVAATEEGAGSSGLTFEENLLVLVLILGILLLILILVLTIRAKIQRLVDEKEGKVKEKGEPSLIAQAIDDAKTFITKDMNPTLLVLTVGGILSVFLVLDLYNRAQDLGSQIGYAPDQPIKFSHKLHAGQYGIDCQYCHTGVEKSKNANIPSANICMNCHSVIQNGPKYGAEEIGKIYAAIGFEPAANEYSGETKPIEWVRIHNLPDHVYFNHQQHVVAGNLDCENCHGKVQEMEVVQQVSLLEMGWCIDCHRESEVITDNNYYQEHFHEVFKDDYSEYLESNTNTDEDEKMTLAEFIKDHKKYTVADMGGLECQKCHY